MREHIIDQRARTLLEFVKKSYANGIPENAPEGKLDTPETAELLRRIGNEGIVLLKNENDILPFKKDKKVSCFAVRSSILLLTPD